MLLVHAPSIKKPMLFFVGQVIEIGKGVKTNNGNDIYPVKFKVEKTWKGVKSSEITILTGDVNVAEEVRACGGFNFVEGEKYLVYANGKQLEVNTCSCCPPTNPIKSESASDEIRRLNSFWFRLLARLPFF